MGIQETWISNSSDQVSIPGYSWVGTSPSEKRARGVGIFIPKNLSHRVVHVSTEDNKVELIIIEIKSFFNFKIGYVYVHPNASKEDVTEISSHLSLNMVLLGDFNAHHTSWSLAKTNSRGKILRRLFFKNNLKVVPIL